VQYYFAAYCLGNPMHLAISSNAIAMVKLQGVGLLANPSLGSIKLFCGHASASAGKADFHLAFPLPL
jgi:hypothetical protein